MTINHITLLFFQCPSCWNDPSCPDCVSVMAAGAFWLLVLAVACAMLAIDHYQSRRKPPAKKSIYRISHAKGPRPANTRLVKELFVGRDGKRSDAYVLNDGLPYDFDIDYIAPGESVSMSTTVSLKSSPST